VASRVTRLPTTVVSRPRQGAAAEPVQSAQNDALKPDRNARQKNSASCGLAVARRRGLPRPLASRWPARSKANMRSTKRSKPNAGRNSMIISTAPPRAGPTVCGPPGGVDRPPGAEHTPASTADRQHRAADDLDALLLSRMNVKWRRRCVAPHPEFEAQQLAARTHGVGQTRNPLPHRWGFDRFLRTHRSRTLSPSNSRRQANPTTRDAATAWAARSCMGRPASVTSAWRPASAAVVLSQRASTDGRPGAGRVRSAT
jgi:hypothetical protein